MKRKSHICNTNPNRFRTSLVAVVALFDHEEVRFFPRSNEICSDVQSSYPLTLSLVPVQNPLFLSQVGSSSTQGAGSTLINDAVGRITRALDLEGRGDQEARVRRR